MSVTIIGMVKASFTARNGVGSISVPGLQVGDRMMASILDGTTYQQPGGVWEYSVSVADELQQVDSGDLTGLAGEAIFVRGF